MVVMSMVMVVVFLFIKNDINTRSHDSVFGIRGNIDMIALQRQVCQFPDKMVEGDAKIQKGGKIHVAANARKTVVM